MLAASCLAPAGRAVESADPAPSEDQLKAAFLLNFPKYVEWPAEAFPGAQAPIVVTVVGDLSLGEELRRMAAGKAVDGRKLEVRNAESPEDIAPDSRIIFVSDAERWTAGLLAHVRTSPVLTVGEADDFLDAGGMINLARRERRIRLEVSLAPAEAAGLKISSRLLRIAEVVKR